jgi:hypothetical protein
MGCVVVENAMAPFSVNDRVIFKWVALTNYHGRTVVVSKNIPYT